MQLEHHYSKNRNSCGSRWQGAKVPPPRSCENKSYTSMHSGRMRTARTLTISGNPAPQRHSHAGHRMINGNHNKFDKRVFFSIFDWNLVEFIKLDEYTVHSVILSIMFLQASIFSPGVGGGSYVTISHGALHLTVTKWNVFFSKYYHFSLRLKKV